MDPCKVKKKQDEFKNVSSFNQKKSCLKTNHPPATPTSDQHGREGANLIEQIYKEDQQTIESSINSSTWEEQLKALKEEVRKGKKVDLEWKKVQRVLELAEKKRQKDLELAMKKKQKEIEVSEKRKLKEIELAEKKRVKDLEAAEKKRQKEIEQAEKKRLKDELQKLKRAKSKAVKQQLELSRSISPSPTRQPLQQTDKEDKPNICPSIVTLRMSVTAPEAMTETQAVNKPSTVPIAVPVAVQSDPISKGEIGSGTSSENGRKRSKSKEKKVEIYKYKDDKRENKKEFNKWGVFFRKCKSCSHIDSTNSSLRQVESKHTYTKKEKQQISKCKGGYVENSNINDTHSTNNNTKGRREVKNKNKEEKKKKKRGNSNERVSDSAYTTAKSASSVEQTAPTNKKYDNINSTNIIRSTTKARENPIVKTGSSKSTPVIVNSSLLMKQRTSNSSITSNISKSKKGDRVGENNKRYDSIIDNTNNIRSTIKANEGPIVKTGSSKSTTNIVNSSLVMKQRSRNSLNTSKVSKSIKGERVGENGDNLVLNYTSQSSKHSKYKKENNEDYRKRNESESNNNSKNSKTKEITNIKEDDRKRNESNSRNTKTKETPGIKEDRKRNESEFNSRNSKTKDNTSMKEEDRKGNGSESNNNSRNSKNKETASIKEEDRKRNESESNNNSKNSKTIDTTSIKEEDRKRNESEFNSRNSKTKEITRIKEEDRKRNDSEFNSRNSKTKETTSIKASKRSTNSIVNVCSSNNPCFSKKVSVVEGNDDIVVKELEKIEKDRLERASGVKSDAGDGPIAKQSLVYCARKKRRGYEYDPDSERIPCTRALEDIIANPEQECVANSVSHSLLVLVKLFMFYLRQSLKVMKNFCMLATKDKTMNPEVTCLTETVGQIMKAFWALGKEACKYLQCKKIQERCT